MIRPLLLLLNNSQFVFLVFLKLKTYLTTGCGGAITAPHLGRIIYSGIFKNAQPFLESIVA